MILGFTGTREGCTKHQANALHNVLRDTPIARVLHGLCIGADAQCEALAGRLGIPRIAHPGLDPAKRARPFDGNCTILAPAPYLTRNRRIVGGSDLLVACPKQMRPSARGGTWYTARFALEVGIPLVIIWPDGRVHQATSL